MKLIQYTPLLSVLSAKEILRSKFEDWKIKHSIFYENAELNELKFQVFTKNFDFIENHNKRFDLGKETYKVGLNKFADLSKDEFYQIYLEQNEDHGRGAENADGLSRTTQLHGGSTAGSQP